MNIVLLFAMFHLIVPILGLILIGILQQKYAKKANKATILRLTRGRK